MIAVSTLAAISTGAAVLTVAGGGIYLYLRNQKHNRPDDAGNEKDNAERVIDDILQTTGPITRPDKIVIDTLPESSDTKNDTIPLLVEAAPQPPVQQDATEIVEDISDEIDEEVINLLQPTEEEAEILSPESPATFRTAELRVHVFSATEENLRLLLLDRLDEIDEEAPELSRQAICAITLLDEIQQMQSAYSEHNATALADLSQAVRQQLTELNCELLSSDVWDPETQKIGKISYDLPAGSEPIVTAKLSSGLKINGQIIRKQSVALSKSAPEL